MGDAHELLFVTEATTPCLSSSLIAPVALRRAASRLRSSSKKKRLAASIPRFGMKLRLRLAIMCGIMIPHMMAPTTCADS
jgi:hypothetical protein